MSLGGAQDKLLLARINGRWCTPINGYPSTHILKPTTVWPHSAENEALVLALSRASALSTTRIAFFVTSPKRKTIPMIDPIASVVPERKTPTMAPTAASGRVVNMIVIG